MRSSLDRRTSKKCPFIRVGSLVLDWILPCKHASQTDCVRAIGWFMFSEIMLRKGSVLPLENQLREETTAILNPNHIHARTVTGIIKSFVRVVPSNRDQQVRDVCVCIICLCVCVCVCHSVFVRLNRYASVCVHVATLLEPR